METITVKIEDIYSGKFKQEDVSKNTRVIIDNSGDGNVMRNIHNKECLTEKQLELVQIVIDTINGNGKHYMPSLPAPPKTVRDLMFSKLQLITSVYQYKITADPAMARIMSYRDIIDPTCEFLTHQAKYLGDTRGGFNGHTLWAYDVAQNKPVPHGKKSLNITTSGDAQDVIISYRSAMDNLIMSLDRQCNINLTNF